MINKKQAQAYMARWARVAEIEKEELRTAVFNDRLLQTLSLIGLGISMAKNNITKVSADDISVRKIRDLWITLKKAPTQIKDIPDTYGIYIFKDKKGKTLYVGKAKSLKKRVMSYFQKSGSHSVRIASMISKVSDIDFIVTNTEIEALILESNFIKKYKPRYNIVLRDDKQYPYLKLSLNEDFPKLEIVRRVVRDRTMYFGPYIPTGMMRQMVKQLYKIFPLRQSKDILDNKPKRRPCLNYQMGRCLAPCAGYVTKGDYAAIVKGVILFLKGKNNDLIEYLTQQMKHSAAELRFEDSAALRDRIAAIKISMQKQQILSTEKEEQDVISHYRQGDHINVQIMFIRSGKIIGKRGYTFKRQEMSGSEIIYSVLKQYYGKGEYIPDEIIIKDRMDDRKLIEQWLTGQKGSKVSLTSPQRGRKFSLIRLATENARLSLKKESDSFAKNTTILIHLKETLSLLRIPAHIEAVDISNISGKMPVGSLVVFRNAKPSKSEYKRFKIKSVDAIDDYAMTGEVIRRRYSRLIKEGEQFPDLIIIDGGKGQLNTAITELKKLEGEFNTDIIGIAKGKDRGNIETDEIFVNDSKTPVVFNSASSARLLLQQIRDEAHRFAITYHRALRKKGALVSELDKIEGIGKKLKLSLLKHFGSVTKIKEADIKKLMEAPGIHKKKAEDIYRHFHHANSKFI